MVEDNGIGIPEENLHKIFEENFTDQSGANTMGLGFGLPNCLELIIQMKGCIM